MQPSLRLFERQRKVGDLAVADVNRAARRGLRHAANMLIRYQAASIDVSLQETPHMLAEQGDTSEPVASVRPTALLTPPSAVMSMMAQTADQYALDRLTTSLVYDAGRSAANIDMTTRDTVIGYVRIVGGTCCARCAVLAGRIYRYSTGFLRHSNCRCTMEPVTKGNQPRVPTAMDLFNEGRIHSGLSRADVRAINDGADISRVVNVRRKRAGLVEGSSVLTRGGGKRGGVLTPAGIYRMTDDRTEQLRLLRKAGYIT